MNKVYFENYFKKLIFWDFIGQFGSIAKSNPIFFAKNEFLDPKNP